jgi:N-acetylglucosamine malate deacetylase 1
MAPCVMAIAAHADDIEFGMAGTLLLLARRGWRVHYMNVADGSCGSTEHDGATIAAIRLKEAQAAARHLDAVFHPPLAPDLEIAYEPRLLKRLASVVRSAAPDVVLLPSLEDYMEDHTIVARLGVTATFSRAMPNFPVEPAQPAVAKPVTIYHAQPHGNRDAMGRLIVPEYFVDISSVLEDKAAMLAEHESQRSFLDQMQGMGAFVETMRAFAREVGAMSGRCEFAEGWRRHNPLGLCAPNANPLAEALGSLMLGATA